MTHEFIVWLTPHPGWKQGEDVFPISSTLRLIQRADLDKTVLAETINNMVGKEIPIFMSQAKVDLFLAEDAEHWSWMKTGHHGRPETFDREHYKKLLDALKTELAKTGQLDFSKINAGVKV